ncbi:hypothetical protein X744_27685 [Mesorhizobium sp. LNJC372A00]|nr:hypothetical protein X770_27895 [Mesorhizobium sp. LSJC269B00]ESX10345.1 hypothetical protein X768_15415 [Mesorhizobium sp. LSJC265A00]ESX17369.1 hypothetical protein X767_25790 [Mesorhizobium sp. LSJC264A00]ESX22221.1 hypothetical protein X766_01665 [Mesorhizobium sp. LSJC255A00]ESX42527.1 hypothetical protein X764_12205 [Mesorhizobium sp. LSHC440A00]ESX48430.1 hypothetical protein X762_14505 [Mesorhizobium sp. LSHC426A00]ESX88698.1 hypothetical protein X756_10540 [Mesorhizobium sp. LSHC4
MCRKRGVECRSTATALRDGLDRAVDRQARGFVLMLFNILFQFTLHLWTGSGLSIAGSELLLHRNSCMAAFMSQA